MKNSLTLVVETSTFHGSVAVGRGVDLLAWQALSAERRHTTELMPTIAKLLDDLDAKPADIEVLAFSQGPGSFTGIRVAATVARTWHAATGCRVVALPTLSVIAQNALCSADTARHLAVMLDARQGKVYGAVFDRDGADKLRERSPADMHDVGSWIAGLPRPCGVLGEGLARHQEAVEAAGLTALPEETWRPDARSGLAIAADRIAQGAFCAPEQIVPAYLRPPECEEVYEKRRAAARAKRGE